MTNYLPWILMVVYIIILKVRRHGATKQAETQKKGVADAENLAITLLDSVRRREPDPLNQVKLLNEITGEVPDDNLAKRLLIDGVSTLCEEKAEKKFTPIAGTHPLQALANRATEAETTKARRVRKIKRGVKIGAEIVKGVFF